MTATVQAYFIKADTLPQLECQPTLMMVLDEYHACTVAYIEKCLCAKKSEDEVGMTIMLVTKNYSIL